LVHDLNATNFSGKGQQQQEQHLLGGLGAKLHDKVNIPIRGVLDVAVLSSNRGALHIHHSQQTEIFQQVCLMCIVLIVFIGFFVG
jgi:hypothetical protein